MSQTRVRGFAVVDADTGERWESRDFPVFKAEDLQAQYANAERYRNAIGASRLDRTELDKLYCLRVWAIDESGALIELAQRDDDDFDSLPVPGSSSRWAAKTSPDSPRQRQGDAITF